MDGPIGRSLWPDLIVMPRDVFGIDGASDELRAALPRFGKQILS
jgi:hypothetical protein